MEKPQEHIVNLEGINAHHTTCLPEYAVFLIVSQFYDLFIDFEVYIPNPQYLLKQRRRTTDYQNDGQIPKKYVSVQNRNKGKGE